ncbi:uncharacterized protein TrAFT101_006744 [Trichoderma asperellum]|uniref:uncharacterized protein n=1 Tax=Trichoderma asperellum TaxID=101201 RepID=UPI003320E8BD|nr:hypothetical protein TrAFT101_006744 [Trichoderma asperellum]
MDDFSDQRPARRMRLGTKSCAECRRRKVRCVFPQNSSICHGCSLHQTPCRAQQPRPKDGGRPGHAQVQGLLQSQSVSQLAADNAVLRRRVAELEDLIGSLCDALEPNDEASSASASGAASSTSASTLASSTTPADINTRAIQVITNLKNHGLLQNDAALSYNFGAALVDPVPNTVLPNIGEVPTSGPPSSLLSPGSLDHESSSSPPDYADKAITAVDAPLINLFRDALLIRETEGELYDDPEDPSMTYLMKESISSFKPPIPDPETLRLILEDSKSFWPIWPTYYFGPEFSNVMHIASLDVAEAYLSQILNYSRGVDFCNAILFLTLCIQQLPRQWKRVIISPNISRQVIIDTYIRFALVLLAVEGEASPQAVQCYLLLHKILINMGRPQRAWMAIRHSISAATVIGLDRLDANASIQKKSLWAQTWQMERQLCMMLGFPSAVSSLGTKDDSSMTQMLLPAQTVFRRTCVIMGRVIDRNQNSHESPYATTVQLDQDMEDLKRDFPPEWAGEYDPSLSMPAIYSQEAAQIFYYSTLKHVHLPFMLKAKTDRRYEHSRLSTMEACRELIKAYLRLRRSPKSESVQCELMDFTMFSSAITLILGILSGSPNTEGSLVAVPYCAEEYRLIDSLIGELRRTDSLLECTVARQSAQVLETLVAASYGTYNAQDDFTLVVPYFGRLRISQGTRTVTNGNADTIASSVSSHNNSTLASPSVASTVELSSLPPKQIPGEPFYLPQPSNTIEFSSNEFLNTTFSDFDFQMDLSQDWCTIVDTNVQYDWNQLFNGTNNMELR